MASEKTPKRKAKPFAAGPIRGITSNEEEVKCRILVALGKLSGKVTQHRVAVRAVIAESGVEFTEAQTAIRELNDAGALYLDSFEDQVRLYYDSNKKRVNEAETLLRLRTAYKRG